MPAAAMWLAAGSLQFAVGHLILEGHPPNTAPTGTSACGRIAHVVFEALLAGPFLLFCLLVVHKGAICV